MDVSIQEVQQILFKGIMDESDLQLRSETGVTRDNIQLDLWFR